MAFTLSTFFSGATAGLSCAKELTVKTKIRKRTTGFFMTDHFD